MVLDRVGLKVFLYQGAIDMRCGFERLTFLVEQEMGRCLERGSLFLFLGNNRKRLKGLYFDGSGLVLMTKRMENHVFMGLESLGGKVEIEYSDLELLLHGGTIRRAA
jgi:transposase